jgi:DNA polymerase III epsilon subunit family exonuclease
MMMTLQTSLFSFGLQDVSSTEADTPRTETLLSDTTFTVIDLETTGLNPRKNSITEVTAIQYVNGEEVAKFSTLVRPNDAISPEVEHLTGITPEMVATAPPLMMVMNDLLQFMGPAPVLVGHNVSFDIGFLQAKCEECGFHGMENRLALEKAFCTRVLAKQLLPGLPSYEGIVVANQCGYYNPNPHRAEADVRMAAAILFSLIEKAQEQDSDCTTLDDLSRLQGPLVAR